MIALSTAVPRGLSDAYSDRPTLLALARLIRVSAAGGTIRQIAPVAQTQGGAA